MLLTYYNNISFVSIFFLRHFFFHPTNPVIWLARDFIRSCNVSQHYRVACEDEKKFNCEEQYFFFLIDFTHFTDKINNKYSNTQHFLRNSFIFYSCVETCETSTTYTLFTYVFCSICIQRVCVCAFFNLPSFRSNVLHSLSSSAPIYMKGLNKQQFRCWILQRSPASVCPCASVFSRSSMLLIVLLLLFCECVFFKFLIDLFIYFHVENEISWPFTRF